MALLPPHGTLGQLCACECRAPAFGRTERVLVQWVEAGQGKDARAAPFASLNAKRMPRDASGRTYHTAAQSPLPSSGGGGQHVLVAEPDDRAHKLLVPLYVLPDGCYILAAPLFDGCADAKAAQHRHPRPESEVTKFASCGPEGVVLPLVRGPLHQPVVALLGRVGKLDCRSGSPAS